MQNGIADITAKTTETAKPLFLLTTDKYEIDKAGKYINFNLMFNNYSATSVSTVVLSDVDSGDITLIDAREGFLLAIDVNSDDALSGKFLKIQSTVSAGTTEEFPELLDIVLSIYGGKTPKDFSVKPASITSSGDVFNVNFTIFFMGV